MELQTVTQTITDPAEWDGSLFGTTLELVQLAGGEFCSAQTVTDLGMDVKLLRLTVNQSVKVRSRRLTLRYVGTLFERACQGQFAGAAIAEDRLLIMPPSFDFDASIKDGRFTCYSFFVPPEHLESYYRTLVGVPLEPFHALKIAAPDNRSIRWLAAWPEIVTAENLAILSNHQRTSIQESLRDNVLSLLTYALQAASTDEHSDWELNGDATRLSKARNLVRLAEDFSNRHPDISLRMVDLCSAVGVSERTLQYAFQMCLGISPMNYLKRHRLHQVRHELKNACPNNRTVTGIACQFGFFHFGDFSQAYKSQFDESPSQTLKQS